MISSLAGGPAPRRAAVAEPAAAALAGEAALALASPGAAAGAGGQGLRKPRRANERQAQSPGAAPPRGPRGSGAFRPQTPGAAAAAGPRGSGALRPQPPGGAAGAAGAQGAIRLHGARLASGMPRPAASARCTAVRTLPCLFCGLPQGSATAAKAPPQAEARRGTLAQRQATVQQTTPAPRIKIPGRNPARSPTQPTTPRRRPAALAQQTQDGRKPSHHEMIRRTKDAELLGPIQASRYRCPQPIQEELLWSRRGEPALALGSALPDRATSRTTSPTAGRAAGRAASLAGAAGNGGGVPTGKPALVLVAAPEELAAPGATGAATPGRGRAGQETPSERGHSPPPGAAGAAEVPQAAPWVPLNIPVDNSPVPNQVIDNILLRKPRAASKPAAMVHLRSDPGGRQGQTGRWRQGSAELGAIVRSRLPQVGKPDADL
ncbi:unnamed protein product [Prorocentrum cordatum]|uniref:Uncharacterized protein n=1 Tax=Prorocentrum cordatum TaxID=2364126 RepID=A0ABN9T936_9DINO|nr:unnamed protein product [Polarella glacialis]